METIRGKGRNVVDQVFPTGVKIYSWFFLNILKFLSGVLNDYLQSILVQSVVLTIMEGNWYLNLCPGLLSVPPSERHTGCLRNLCV